MVIVLIVVSTVLIVISLSVVAYSLYSFRAICESFRAERTEIIKIIEGERSAAQDKDRDEVRALTEAMAKVANVHLFYPRRGSLEPTDGWLDGKPKIVKVSNDLGVR